MFWNVLELSSMSLYHTVLYHAVLYCTKGVIREQNVPRVPGVPGDKRCQGCQGTKGAKGSIVLKVPRVPGSRAQKVYLGAGFSQELSSNRA